MDALSSLKGRISPVWVLMKRGASSRERVIIIGCDSGGLKAGSRLAPMLVLQESG